jgi:hypothetical protein
MNIQYAGHLQASLPKAVAENMDIMFSIGDYHVLVNEEKLKALQESVDKISNGDPDLFKQTESSIRSSAESGLKVVFFIGGGTMLLAFLLILTIPKIPLDRPPEADKI